MSSFCGEMGSPRSAPPNLLLDARSIGSDPALFAMIHNDSEDWLHVLRRRTKKFSGGRPMGPLNSKPTMRAARPLQRLVRRGFLRCPRFPYSEPHLSGRTANP
jgi:hypothetical protein